MQMSARDGADVIVCFLIFLCIPRMLTISQTLLSQGFKVMSIAESHEVLILLLPLVGIILISFCIHGLAAYIDSLEIGL